MYKGSPALGDITGKAVELSEATLSGAKIAGIAAGIFLSVYLVVKTRSGYRAVKAKAKELAKYRVRLIKEEK